MFEARSAIVGLAAIYYVVSWLRVVEDDTSAPLALLTVPLFFCITLFRKDKPVMWELATPAMLLVFAVVLEAELRSLFLLPAIDLAIALARKQRTAFGILLGTICLAWVIERRQIGYEFDDLLRAILALALAVFIGYLLAAAIERQEEERARSSDMIRGLRESLHHMVASEISEAVVKLEMSSPSEPHHADFVEDAKRASRRALRHLGTIFKTEIAIESPTSQVPANGLHHQFLEQLVRLQDHGFRVLVFGDPPNLTDPAAKEAIQLGLKEMTTNILKYGDRTQPAEFSFWEEENHFTVESKNHIRQPIDRTLATDQGLKILDERIREMNGAIRCGAHDTTWSIILELPKSSSRRV